MSRIGGPACVAALALACSSVGPVAADTLRSSPDATVSAVLPGCRALITTAPQVITSAEAAFCSGTVNALRYVGELLPEDYCYAVPLSLPDRDVVATLVREIGDVYATVERQLFKGLAIEILHFHWPCRARD
jgi:hypothetical protein